MVQSAFDFKVKVKPKTEKCPCCGHQSIVYRRKLLANMSFVLLQLYRHKKFSFIHVEKFLLENNYPRSGDFHKLVLWGLLEKQKGEREDGCKYTGMYKITGRGMAFCDNKLTVPQTAVILNNKFKGFEGIEVSIKDTLGERFNYDQLLSEV